MISGETPITPDEAVAINVINHDGERVERLTVGKGYDIIYVFSEERYNYLQYIDTNEGMLARRWLGSAALNQLIEAGIPIAMREDITQSEYQQWLDAHEHQIPEDMVEGFVQFEAMGLEQELDEFLYGEEL